MSLDEMIKLGGMLIGIGSIYGLIRADIRHMHEKFSDISKDIARVERASDKAHERLDSHIEVYHRSKS